MSRDKPKYIKEFIMWYSVISQKLTEIRALKWMVLGQLKTIEKYKSELSNSE